MINFGIVDNENAQQVYYLLKSIKKNCKFDYTITLIECSKNNPIKNIIDGETVADVLSYVQYEPKKLVRSLEVWVKQAIKDGKVTLDEGKEFLDTYRSGLYGYTYLE